MRNSDTGAPWAEDDEEDCRENYRLLQQQISPPKCRSTWVLNQSTGPEWVGELALRRQPEYEPDDLKCAKARFLDAGQGDMTS